jgi:hypothetical protein
MATIVDPVRDDIQLFVSYSHADVEAAKELFAACRTLEDDAIARCGSIAKSGRVSRGGHWSSNMSTRRTSSCSC